MNLNCTYLSEEDRLKVARSYISHEIKKIAQRAVEEMAKTIASRTTTAHAAIFRNMWPGLIKRSGHPDALLLETPCLDLWKLFHAISYGRFLKKLHNCVGHPDFIWDIRNVCLDHIDIETKVGIFKCAGGGNSPLPFLTALDHTRALDKIKLEQSLAVYDRDSEQDRASDPLIGRLKEKNRVLIHDGNGRVARICALVALDWDAPKEVSVWAGTEGKPDPLKHTLYQECCKSIFATRSA